MNAAVADSGAESHSGPWPRGVSHAATMSIGRVVDRLKTEFPAVTPSKLRFLEGEGVVSPARTATGYRKFSEADIERLRYCLSMQRDSYLPIAAIVDQLAALDAGHEAEIAPTARVVASEGELVAPVRSDLTVTAAELCALTGLDAAELEQIVATGLITPDLAGYFPKRALEVVRTVVALRREGIPLRNLRYLHTFALRHVDLVDQVTNTGRRDRSGAEKERRLARSSEIAELLSTLATELTRMEIGQLD